MRRACFLGLLYVAMPACGSPSEPDPRGRYAYTITTSATREYSGKDAEFFTAALSGGNPHFALYVGDSVYFTHFPALGKELPSPGTYQVGNGVYSDQTRRMGGDVYNALEWPVWVDEELSTITLDVVAPDRITGRFDITLIHETTSQRVGTLIGRFDARRREDCRVRC